ncbi:MAG: imidazolonepropionase [Candidatus Devosia phytovorans]|uniref:Imidazolonepropionase n=1 Tax=Candidatus Devosia phytovorans TaxID=3121372 RepID=A0AAJ5VWS8_9HYPH|nr:imidazolonepropionase [Devosia sp.]WEK04922.1 MAG: imidazolonepropionase [Devosia sp.]
MTNSIQESPIRVWQNARLLTGVAGGALIPDAVIVTRGETIDFAGPESNAPTISDTAEIIDLDGRLVTPALIDCHTHIVHGGNRAREFEMRLEGASYVEIAKAGGGIMSTVNATRQLDVDGLVAQALPRLDALLAEGVTTIEIKSGYGLTIKSELDMLRAARRLAGHRDIRVATSFLGAHAVPVEYSDRKQDFLDEVVLPALDLAHAEGLVDAVDGFCEGIAFTSSEMAQVFDRAQALGLPVKLHAEQLTHSGGTLLAASRGALSADHLEYIGDTDAAALAESGTVAVLLPGAYYAIRETQRPDIAALRRHGVPMAVATDCNPGTSPLTSLLLAMNMAATLFHLTVDECLAGVTRNAARALGLQDVTGTIEAGKSADLAIWDCAEPAELVYRMGFNPLQRRIFKGRTS